MIGKKRHISKKVIFLLTMNCDEHPWTIPEFTLWANFDDAFVAAATAVQETKGEDACWSELSLEAGKTAFLPECFEIMPISLSTPECITWFGQKRKEHIDNE